MSATATQVSDPKIGADDAGERPTVGARLRGVARHPSTRALAVYLVIALLLFRAGWVSPTTHNIGGPGDPPFNMWLLRWTPWALSNGQSPLFTDHLNFPFGVNMMWNALVPLHALVLWPVTALAGVVAAYNTFITLNVVLSAWAGYLVLRCFVERKTAAFVGGLLYGFSPYMMAQSLDHPTLTAAYLPPVLLLLLREILVRQRRSALWMGALLGLVASVQLFIAEEMLAAQVLVAGLGLLLLVTLHPKAVRARWCHAAGALGAAAAVFVLVCSWPLLVQFFGPQRLTGGSVHEPNVYVTDLANLVMPTEVQALSPSSLTDQQQGWTGNRSEWDGYLGIPLLIVLVAVVARHWRRSEVRFAGLAALVVTILSLGPNLRVNGYDTGFPLPWRVFGSLPLLDHLLPARLMLFTFLLAALVVAIAVDRVRWEGRPRRLLPAGVAGVAIGVTLMPNLAYPSTPVPVPSFFTNGSVNLIPEGSVALLAPIQQLYPAEPMLWQAEADLHFRIPHGYFFAPDENGEPTYGSPFSVLSVMMYRVQINGEQPELTPDVRRALADDLRMRDVQSVIVGPMNNQDQMVRFFTELFGQSPQAFDRVFLWQRTDRLLLRG